jgi:uncharacterized protein YndB with AHSA1/START domain
MVKLVTLALRIVGALLVVVIFLLGVGLLLPARFSVARSVDIAGTPERVYGLIASPREWARWSAWNRRDPAMAIDYSGPERGAGAAWHWSSRSEGRGRMVFTQAVAGQRIEYALDFDDFGMRSHGALTIDPAGSRVRVNWTNEGDLGFSPLSRWFGLFMDRLVGPDFEAGLRNLKALAETG